MKNSNLPEAALALLGGLALGSYSLVRFRSAAVRLPWALSPWLFPLLLAVFALLLSAALLWEGRAPRAAEPGGQDLKKLGLLLGLSLLYALLLPWLHFVPASALYLAALMGCLGERRWPLIAAVALLLPLLLFALFGLGLRVRLP